MKRAQSISEFVTVMALVAVVLLGMQVYVKRGIQARVRDMTDVMLPPGTVDSGVKHIEDVNVTIPVLDFATGQKSEAKQDIQNRIYTEDDGRSIVYETSPVDGHLSSQYKSHVVVLDPSKKIDAKGSIIPKDKDPKVQ